MTTGRRRVAAMTAPERTMRGVTMREVTMVRVAQRESESVKLILRWLVCSMHRRPKASVHAAYRTAGTAMLEQNCVRLVTITISNGGRRTALDAGDTYPGRQSWTSRQNRPAS